MLYHFVIKHCYVSMLLKCGLGITKISEEQTLDDIWHLKYASITSVDVEKSFSMYKNILSDNNWRSLVFEHIKIKQYMIVQCNAQNLTCKLFYCRI